MKFHSSAQQASPRMALPGQKFVLDLSDEDEEAGIDSSRATETPRQPASSILIGDVLERNPAAAIPPSAPTPASSAATGFPTPRNRVRQSAFKQRQKNTANPTLSNQGEPVSDPTKRDGSVSQPLSVEEEKRSIDDENRQRIAAMSPAQVEKERAELLSDLPASLLERLLRRANISEDPSPTRREQSINTKKKASIDTPDKDGEGTNTTMRTSGEVLERLSQGSEALRRSTAASNTDEKSLASDSANDELPPRQPPADLRPASEFPTGPIHFPTPPPRQTPMPNLDPSSPSFLSDLQSHYFPDISHDSSSLSWLQPPSRDAEDPDASSPYHPASSASSVSPSAIRFSLIGTILSPNTSLSLPTTLGLHHHANDPEAAGYTIPELAILSRSTLPAQRCIAWQVIGRMLFRLGKGEFGERGTPLVDGLWSVVEREGVVARMLEEAEGGEGNDTKEKPPSTSRIGRHASAKAWALEGIWLWRMGGGVDRGILKEGTVRST